MKLLLSFLVLPMLFIESAAQTNSFGLLKYSIPGNWQEQSKQHVISYSGIESETGIPIEIKVYENRPAGVKPDSSFHMEWKRIFSDQGNPAVPYAKKRYNAEGIQLAVNVATTAEIIEGNQKKFTQLAVFIIDKQVQAIQFVAYNATDFKKLRPYIDDFIDGTSAIAKGKE